MRDIRIDVLRGILILTVVLGHTDFLPKPLMSIIYSFHMPSFFLLSGCLFSIDSQAVISKRIVSKFKRLIIPAWILGAICSIPFLIGLIISPSLDALIVFLTKLVGTIGGYPTWSNTFNCTPLWFLFSLFMVEVIAISITARWKRICILFLIGVVGVILSLYVKVYTPFNIAISLSGMIFFAIGAYVRKLGCLERFIGLTPAFLSFVVFFCDLFAMCHKCEYGIKHTWHRGWGFTIYNLRYLWIYHFLEFSSDDIKSKLC